MTTNTPHYETRRNWSDDAACLAEDPELFWPVGTGPDALIQTEQAKAVCRACPVLATCARWAIETRQEAGVSGGMDEREKRAAIRKVQQGQIALDGVVPLVKQPAISRRKPVVHQILDRRELLETMAGQGMKHHSIALRIGVPGATKSTVGAALAKIRQEKTRGKAQRRGAVAA